MNSKPRVLVIEDQPLMATTISKLLRKAGCDVAEAPTAEQALELADHDDFNLVTTGHERFGIVRALQAQRLHPSYGDRRGVLRTR